jgi:hypothetical protein
VRRRGRDLAVSFRAPGDDLFCGKVSSYDVRLGKRKVRVATPTLVDGRKRQTLRLPAAAKRRGVLVIRALDEAANAGYGARVRAPR